MPEFDFGRGGPIEEPNEPHLQEAPFVPELGKDDEVIDLGESFNLDSFQVVRREFFAHLNEPSITFNGNKVYVNMACLSKFPTVEYVQVIINPETKILALRPRPESARDVFPWCSTNSRGKRQPKQTTGRLFSAMLFSLMEWNPDYRYKLLGKVIYANGEYLIAFDLKATEVYMKTYAEGKRPKTSRNPVFPIEWQTQFGLPLKEHKQSLKINIFDGYAIFKVKDDSKSAPGELHLAPTDISGQPLALAEGGGEDGGDGQNDNTYVD